MKGKIEKITLHYEGAGGSQVEKLTRGSIRWLFIAEGPDYKKISLSGDDKENTFLLAMLTEAVRDTMMSVNVLPGAMLAGKAGGGGMSHTPELLEALKGLVPHCHEEGMKGESDYERAWLKAEAAIAKAEDGMSAGINMIAAERQRQMEQEGWTPEHDAQHKNGELAIAAACYAAWRRNNTLVINGNHVEPVDAWPWDSMWDKRRQHPLLRRLEIAGALIAAEIDRILREEAG